MIDSLVVGGVVLEKEVPDSDINLKNLCDTIERPMKRIDALIHGIDFGAGPDHTGRVYYWVAPFKYKTAGINHQMVHSDFGMTWKYVYGWWGLDLKNLPINYNFDMAKLYFGNFVDKESARNKIIIRLMLNTRYGLIYADRKSTYNFCKKYNVLYAPRSAYKMNFDRWFELFYGDIEKIRRNRK